VTCQDARERFTDSVDETLAAEEVRALTAHLATCADCRRELERFRRTVALLRSVEPARAPAGFVDRVLAAARPEPWSRRVLRWVFRPLAVKLPLEVAAVAVVAVAAVYLYERTPDVRRAADLATPSSAPAPQSSVPTTPPVPSPAPAPAAPAPSTVAPAPFAKETAPPPAAPVERPASGPEPRADVGRQAAEAPRAQVTEKPAELYASGAKKEAEAPSRDRPAGAAGAPEPTREEQLRARQAAPLAAAPEAPEGAREPKAPTPPSVHRFSARALVSVDVAGRLVVGDRGAARLRLDQLVVQLGGTLLARRPDPEAPAAELVEILLPRAAYAEFVGELGRLGRWLPEREALESTEHVRIVVRLTD
jgi:anti-sigma factor RsiW